MIKNTLSFVRHPAGFRAAIALILAAVLTGQSPAQSLVPQYTVAKGWSTYVGLTLSAADAGAVAGGEILPPNLAYNIGGFLNTNGTPGNFVSFGSFQAANFNAVAHFGNRYLFGGQTNNVAMTYSETGNTGSSPLIRTLLPGGYYASTVNGVTLYTNQSGLVETVVGTVSSGFVNQAAWWENGNFNLLANPPSTGIIYSSANAVSGTESQYLGELISSNTPAFCIVGYYGTNLIAPPHACAWLRLAGNGGYYQEDIHPVTFASSEALGVGEAYYTADYSASRVVCGAGTPLGGTYDHALIWDYGDEPHDVNPPGFLTSTAVATTYSKTVGTATTSNGVMHAMLWCGKTPVDLHGYFPDAMDSRATGVSTDGRIVGYYHDTNNQTIPFVLAPVAAPALQPYTIGNDILTDTNEIYSKFFLPGLTFSYPVINNAGVTCFHATYDSYPGLQGGIFTRQPGGPVIPRLFYYEPLDNSLVNYFYTAALDDAGTLHAVVSTFDKEGVEMSVDTNDQTQVYWGDGDLLPDGSTVQSVNDLVCSDDGKVAITGYAVENDEFILLHQGAKTLVLRTTFGYPSGTNQPNNLTGFNLGGVSTNGQVIFTALRSIFTDPTNHYLTQPSVFVWSNNVMTELLHAGSYLADNYWLDRPHVALINARGDIAVLAAVTNAANEEISGLWRRMAGSSSWETIAVAGGLAPGGEIDAIANVSDNFSLNNAGSILFGAIVGGQATTLIARPGAVLTNFRSGQDATGRLRDFSAKSFNQSEETVSVVVPAGDNDYATQIEFFCPRPLVVNPATVGTNMTFNIQTLVNRPYNVSYAFDVTGPWTDLVTNIYAKSTLTQVVDPIPAGASQRIYRSQRVP